MKIKNATVDQFIRDVKEMQAGIILCGMGVIGKVCIPAFLENNNLQNDVVCVVDSDIYKQGTFFEFGARKMLIESFQKIETIKKDFVVLVTGSRYEGILAGLEKLKIMLSDVPVYVFPEMLVKNCRVFPKINIIKESERPLIPKIIHYCWFGGKEVPQEFKNNIASWKRFCPDYEIIEWNESNYDVKKYPFIRQAYTHKKWGFITDVARLDILQQYGGIYFDTDVEVIKPLDDLLYQKGFCSVEKWGVINSGGGCGVIPNHPAINKILQYRLGFEFERGDGSFNLESSGSYETIPLLNEGFVPNNSVQKVMDMMIYTSDFFHPYDYMSKELCVTDNTYAIHHFTGSWL